MFTSPKDCLMYDLKQSGTQTTNFMIVYFSQNIYITPANNISIIFYWEFFLSKQTNSTMIAFLCTFCNNFLIRYKLTMFSKHKKIVFLGSQLYAMFKNGLAYEFIHGDILDLVSVKVIHKEGAQSMTRSRKLSV